jgi:hypothetical protein
MEIFGKLLDNVYLVTKNIDESKTNNSVGVNQKELVY